MNERDLVRLEVFRELLRQWKEANNRQDQDFANAAKNLDPTIKTSKSDISRLRSAQYKLSGKKRIVFDGVFHKDGTLELDKTIESLTSDHLEERSSKSLKVAYLLITFKGGSLEKALKFVKLASKEEIVVEASAIHGNYSVILKLNYRYIEEITQFVLDKGRHTESTSTLISLEGGHWQRQQEESLEMISSNDEITIPSNIEDMIELIDDHLRIHRSNKQNFVNEIAVNYLSLMTGRMKTALSGEIFIDDESDLKKYSLELVRRTEHSIKGLVIWDQRRKREEERHSEYLREQKMAIDRGVNIERVFFAKSYDPELQAHIQSEVEIGINAYYKNIDSWNWHRSALADRRLRQKEDFGIYDERFAWIFTGGEIDREAMRTATIVINKDTVNYYIDLFKRNSNEPIAL